MTTFEPLTPDQTERVNRVTALLSMDLVAYRATLKAPVPAWSLDDDATRAVMHTQRLDLGNLSRDQRAESEAFLVHAALNKSFSSRFSPPRKGDGRSWTPIARRPAEDGIYLLFFPSRDNKFWTDQVRFENNDWAPDRLDVSWTLINRGLLPTAWMRIRSPRSKQLWEMPNPSAGEPGQ